MTDKGTCEKHGEFILAEGCASCLAERDGAPAEQSTTAPTLFPAILPADQTALIKIKPELDADVQAFYNQALSYKKAAEDRVIAKVSDLTLANDDLSIIARVKKSLLEIRASYVQPIEDQLKAVRGAFDVLLEPILQATEINKKKMLVFDAEQRRLRQEQEAINRQKEELAAREAALNGKPVEPVEMVELAPEAPKSVGTDLGISGMVDHWKYVVEDFILLPNEYKVADNAQLTAIAKRHHDKKPIPGVRFYNEPYVATRTR